MDGCWIDDGVCVPYVDKSNEGPAPTTTHCPDCRSFSLTTAQLVSDSSSVGHRAACMVCEEEDGEKEQCLKRIEHD